jgi:hypothetical protein
MSNAPLKVTLETELVTVGQKAVYHYLLIEKKWVTPLGFTGNVRRVVCTINYELSFQCSLMPNGKGQYYISVNKENRTSLGIGPGDRVQVQLERDQSKYGLPMPEELQAVLDQDPEGDKFFHALTNGKQRSLIFFVSKGKDVDRRIDHSLIILEHLKNNEGKIDFRKLYHELKRPALNINSNEF